MLEQGFEIPADFDIKRYAATEPYFQRRVQVRLYFAPEAAVQALDNRSQWDSLEEHSNGSIIVSLTIPDLEVAASIMMEYGYLAVVLEPEELREVVRKRASGILTRNNPTTETNQ